MGEPLVRIEFSYNETTMFKDIDGEVISVSITEEQLSQLNNLYSTDQMRAASIFGEADGPEYDD